MLVPIKKTFFYFFLGTGIVLCMAFFAVFAPYLTPYSPTEPNVDMMLLPPSSSHVLGTDAVGRDIFTRLLYGARVSLWVGFIAVGISSAIGIALGLISGYFGGIIDEIIMRLVDIMLCFPSFFLILAVIAFFGTQRHEYHGCHRSYLLDRTYKTCTGGNPFFARA